MKSYKLFIGLLIIPALFLAGCSGITLNTGLAQNPSTAVVQSPTQAVAQNAAAPVVAAPAVVQPAAQVQVAAPSDLSAFQSDIEAIYQKVNPSVVSIQVVEGSTLQVSPNSNPFGFGNPNSQAPAMALGSGFVWDKQGHIVTNNHVVSGATNIQVTFSDGTTVDAKLVGADPNADLAVLQVNVPASQLQPVTVADSTQVKVGQVAIAIGNPFGLANTMTNGIISGLERSLPTGLDNQSAQTGPTYAIPDIIQTDASINPGNSGGVLVDIQGQLIGVTAAIESSTNSNAGIGFVIPSVIVKKVVPSLISTGKYDHPWLGITGITLDADLIKANGLSANQKGALVVDVTSGGPAANAGIQGSSQTVTVNSQDLPSGGDVIVALNGQPVKSFEDLAANLFLNTQPGQTVNLTVLRNGKEQTIKITLGVLPAQ